MDVATAAAMDAVMDAVTVAIAVLAAVANERVRNFNTDTRDVFV